MWAPTRSALVGLGAWGFLVRQLGALWLVATTLLLLLVLRGAGKRVARVRPISGGSPSCSPNEGKTWPSSGWQWPGRRSSRWWGTSRWRGSQRLTPRTTWNSCRPFPLCWYRPSVKLNAKNFVIKIMRSRIRKDKRARRRRTIQISY